MARIRTIKPDFFRHEGLQDLEAENPGRYVMLVFAGLWGHCDKAGRFEWKPRTLKLDILPFLEFDMIGTLNLLRDAGFVRRYTVDGREYGVIESFVEHQRIGGKEAQEPEKHPEPPREAPKKHPEQILEAPEKNTGNDSEETGKQWGSIGEALGKHQGLQEGKGIGREEEEEAIVVRGNTRGHAVAFCGNVDNSGENVDNSETGFAPPPAITTPAFKPPTQMQVTTFFVNRGQSTEMADRFFWNYEKKGWVSSKDTPILNWHAAAQSWIAEEKDRQQHRGRSSYRNGHSKAPSGSFTIDPRYPLYTHKEIDQGQMWQDVSLVRIEGVSACRSAHGKVLYARNSDIEQFGLTRREPKPVGEDWPD